MMNMKTEPVALPSMLTGLLVAVVNVLAIAFDWAGDLTASLNILAAAISVAVAWVIQRPRVTPVE